MPFLGLMTVRAHEAVVADLEAIHDENQTRAHEKAMGYQESIKLALKSRDVHMQAASALRAELATLKAERDGILRDKIAETDRINKAVSRGLELIREIETLKPDALKYRERLRRDREALAAKRKRAVAALPKAQAARGGDLREGV